MKTYLNWDISDEAIIFSCDLNKSKLSIDQWALHDIFYHNRRAGIGPILSLLENEDATIHNDIFVNVPHVAISRLSRSELMQIGLPHHMPFNLSIEGRGLLTDNDFRFVYRLIHPNQRPVMGAARNGSILHVGERQYIIPDPLYTIINEIETFNSLQNQNIEEQLLAWARLKELLPNDIIVGEYLKGFRILKADAFTIIPYMNENGEPDFDPVLIKYRQTESDEEIDEKKINAENALPKIPHNLFTEQFRNYSDAHSRYSIPGGWYVVIPKPLQKVLSEIHKIQKGDPEKRQTFLSNPYMFLKSIAEDDIEGETIDYLFYESAEFSDRIREIGFWQPPVLPYIKRSKEVWMPPEEFGLRVGDKLIRIEPEDVDIVIRDVEDAIKTGKLNIEYNGQKIPANSETIDALKRIISEIRPQPNDTRDDSKSESSKERETPIALLIRGNLDELEYKASKRATEGVAISWPQVIKTSPLNHQLAGFQWLQAHWISGRPGALLADDMGLGKTLQALSFMAWLKEQMINGQYETLPMLLVAPTGLLKNWLDECQLHFANEGLGSNINAYGPTLKSLRNPKTGSQKELDHGLPVLDIGALRNADWVLTTYETLRDYQHSFGQIRWAIIVFDEAQKIKNPSVLITDSAKAMNSEFVVALTGTPIENRLSDLWCIVDTVHPGKLGSLRQFCYLYEKESEQQQNHLIELKHLLTESNKPSLMIRRLKEDHLDGLPDKKEYPVRKEMPTSQAEAYQEAVLIARSGGRKKGQILKALHALRSISLHPFQREEETDDEYIKHSARLIIAFDILDKIAYEQNKVLIFTESKVMQGILAEIIQRRYNLEHPILIINGEVSGDRRKSRVDIFQSRKGFDVMLLSPRAGGIGLTLTAASHVIHLSRWWNPAVEDQSTDRVFRIGQEKTVHIYYPLAIHPNYNEFSFDIRLHSLLERKRTLSRTILEPPAGSYQDAENLFNETIDSKVDENSDFFEKIDTMEPEEFENWILTQLSQKGYNAKRTPSSWDRGADGLAIAPKNSGKMSMLIQCKHTQTNKPVRDSAVLEIVKGLSFYFQKNLSLQPVVVTNAKSFTDKAVQLAKNKNVKIVARNDLLNWIGYQI